MTKFAFSAAALAMTIATSTAADQVFNDDVIITQDLLCVGDFCADGEALISDGSIFRSGVKAKDINTSILFEDTSDPLDNFPSTDWRLDANESANGGLNGFFLSDVTGGTTPFKVRAGAPTNSFFMDSNGAIGLGTSLPQEDLHISRSSVAGMTFEATSVPAKWNATVGNTGYVLSDIDAGTSPFIINNGAPTNSIRAQADGDIGLGTSAPEGKLHTRGDGVQLAYFESSDGDAVQVRFRTDSENRRFLAVNNANEVKTQIVFGDDQITFLGETVAQEWLRVSSAGIVSSGPTCSPDPCDRTFDPAAFAVPAIEERGAYMWKNMHLPAVGPTAPDQPFNVTEKMGGVIHELEVAHIYIEQLHDRLEAQEDQVKRQETLIATLMARLDAIETQ